MTALIVADDLVRSSFVKYWYSSYFLLDCANSRKEGGDIIPGCRFSSLDQYDFSLVLASRKTGSLTGKRAIRRDADAGLNHRHDCLGFLIMRGRPCFPDVCLSQRSLRRSINAESRCSLSFESRSNIGA